jgi:putative sensor protein
MTTSTTASSSVAVTPRRFGLADPTTYRSSFHLLADLAIGTATFTVFVTLLATSAALAVTLVGIPILVVTLLLARGLGGLERRRAGVLLGVDVAAPSHQGRGIWSPLRDKADWRALGYTLLLFPMGVVSGTVVLAGWSTAVAAITHPLYAVFLDEPAVRLAGHTLDGPPAEVGTVLLGIALLIVMPYVVRRLAQVDAALVRRLLG